MTLMIGTLFSTTNLPFAMEDRQSADTKSSAIMKHLPPEPTLTSPLPARGGSKVVTADWLLDFPHYGESSPVIKWLNNTHLLYSSPSKENKEQWVIEVLDVRNGASQLLGEGSFPNPSPDSQWIAFILGKEESRQVWIMRSDGTDRKQLSHVQGGLADSSYFFEVAWSPDSKKIALRHMPEYREWEKKEIPKSTIDILDVETGQSKQLASFDAYLRNLSWLPNGKDLLFMKERIGHRYKVEVDQVWVQTANVNDGHLRTLAQFDGLQQSLTPTSSPNGKLVALMYDADNTVYDYMPSLGIVSNDQTNLDTIPPITRLTHEIKLRSPQWSLDGQRIFVLRKYGAYNQLHSIDAKTGAASQITNAPLDIGRYALSPDGSQLAWIGEDAQATRILRVASGDGKNVNDLLITPGVPKDMALSEVREIDWKTPDYPVRMRGLLLMPLNYQKGTRYPLIVDIHGGGAGANILMTGGILENTPLEWHMWAAKGYAVFVPEFRSSASFGSLAIIRDDLQEHDLINCDIKDIEAGIDELIAQGIVDGDRLTAIGHSAGGRRMNWLLATTHRFKGVVSKEGWADEWIQCFNEPPSKRIFSMFGGAPWEVPKNYQKNSAIFHSGGATTPTLFLMGNPELGGADPYKTVHMLYNAIKAQGVETEYVTYPDEGHNFEKPENRRDALERTIKWIDGHAGKK